MPERDSGFVLYASPQGSPALLSLEPRLASWEKKGHPSQIRLRAFLEHLDLVGAPQVVATTGPLAIRLDVALPEQIDLLDERDLDNFVQPICQVYPQDRLVSVWASKRHGAQSRLTIGAALLESLPTSGRDEWDSAFAQPDGSYIRSEWRAQIAEQVGRQAAPAPEGPLELHVSFQVDPARRSWTSLWKPAIDALVPILGRETRRNKLEPRDGRITTLGLHRTDACGSGYAVRLGYWWRPDLSALHRSDVATDPTDASSVDREDKLKQASEGMRGAVLALALADWIRNELRPNTPKTRELAEQMLRVLDLAARDADETNGFVGVTGVLRHIPDLLEADRDGL